MGRRLFKSMIDGLTEMDKEEKARIAKAALPPAWGANWGKWVVPFAILLAAFLYLQLPPAIIDADLPKGQFKE